MSKLFEEMAQGTAEARKYMEHHRTAEITMKKHPAALDVALDGIMSESRRNTKGTPLEEFKADPQTTAACAANYILKRTPPISPRAFSTITDSNRILIVSNSMSAFLTMPLLVLFSCCTTTSASAQAITPAPTTQIKVIVSASQTPSATVIVIPPETSWRGTISFTKANTNANPAAKVSANVADWIAAQTTTNGLGSADLKPWHLVVAYDQFDEDGDNIHSGVLEEFWDAPKRYKIIYKSDNLNQSDYATSSGLYRLGDQRWANRDEIKVRTAFLQPFVDASAPANTRTHSLARTFGARAFNCTGFEREDGAISGPLQYCFDQQGGALRYARGTGWYQTTYNDMTSFQGRSIAREVEVTDAGKPYLRLHVKTLEPIAEPTNADDPNTFTPPQDAVNLQGKRVTGVNLTPLQQPYPVWPDSLREQHLSIKVDIIIGKDGHVTTAHAVEGPKEAYKAAEKAALKWTFHPYLILDEPAEVETTIILNYN